MPASRPVVHPIEVEAPPQTDAVEQPPGLRMTDVRGSPGTVGSLVLRLLQCLCAAVVLATMATLDDLTSVPAFLFLAVASALLCWWSFTLAALDAYAILVKRHVQDARLVWLCTVGDGVTCTLLFCAAWACLGIIALVDWQMSMCGMNPCVQFEAATGLAFAGTAVLWPSFVVNINVLAS